MVRGRRRHAEAVFVDRSGRRRRLLTLVGAAVGVVLVAGLGLFAAGLVGSGPVSLPGWPDPGVQAGQDRPASNTPAPSTATTTPASRRTSRTTPPPAAPTPTPTGVSASTVAPTSGPRAPTEVPGRGDEHRRTPQPTKPPGKPGS
ncbi:MAG: hypothetical protein FWJ93_14045 [Micromonosporaceae bacterium]